MNVQVPGLARAAQLRSRQLPRVLQSKASQGTPGIPRARRHSARSRAAACAQASTPTQLCSLRLSFSRSLRVLDIADEGVKGKQVRLRGCRAPRGDAPTCRSADLRRPTVTVRATLDALAPPLRSSYSGAFLAHERCCK